MEIHYKKDSELDDRLKNVFVKSKDLQVFYLKMLYHDIIICL